MFGIDSDTFEYFFGAELWVLTNQCDMVHVGSRRSLLPEGVVSVLGQSVWNVLSIVALGQVSVRVLLSPVTTTPPVLHAHKILCTDALQYQQLTASLNDTSTKRSNRNLTFPAYWRIKSNVSLGG